MSLRKLPEIRAFLPGDLIQFEAPDSAVARFDGELQAAGRPGDPVISIYGAIGRDPYGDLDNSERRISAALSSIGERDVTVNINSPGGNFFSGLAIYNLLRAHPAKVVVNVLGMAGSAASIIAMAGDEIAMADGSQIMIHKASGVIVGNTYALAEGMKLLAQVDEVMAEIYTARTGAAAADVVSWMENDRGNGTVFLRDEAIAKGFAETKMTAIPIRVAASAAKNIPAEREVERALMAAHGLSASEAKARVAALKTGARDAAEPATRDAGALVAALTAASMTIRA
ncbi:head maturation protease, ClpP-related [Pseudogemmobacter sonorensis]|uniref:head maturation protease, ClpP-related n=1 Tax=Pseudogemmobacter sonorensis TaxID=2989681 RepID=UPI003696A878